MFEDRRFRSARLNPYGIASSSLLESPPLHIFGLFPGSCMSTGQEGLRGVSLRVHARQIRGLSGVQNFVVMAIHYIIYFYLLFMILYYIIKIICCTMYYIAVRFPPSRLSRSGILAMQQDLLEATCSTP